MQSIIDDIWAYGQLADDQRRAVEAYVRTHPELTGLFNEVRALYACFEEARAVRAHEPVDAALAYFVASESIQRHEPPQALAASYERLARRLADDPGLAARYEAVRHRMAYVASFSDPVSEFERLTGHTLDDTSEQIRRARPRPVAYANDRMILRPSRPRSAAGRRTVAVAGVVSVLLIGAVFFGNRNERLAYTDPAQIYYDTRVDAARSFNSPLDELPLDVLLAQAQMALAAAQKTWMDVVFWYDEAGLEEAERLFQHLIERSGPESQLTPIALYYLAKIDLARGNTERAVTTLRNAALAEGRWSTASVELLRRIRGRPADRPQT